jgi:hypothetical protein
LKKSEKEWMDKLVQFGCVVCKKYYRAYTEPCIHHIREGMGMGQRNSTENCLPLCHTHHQGEHGLGFHSGKKTWIEKYGTEHELLEWLKERI